MYEGVDVAGLTPGPFLAMDFYSQGRGCLLQDKGIGTPGPYGPPGRGQLWTGSSHCRYRVGGRRRGGGPAASSVSALQPPLSPGLSSSASLPLPLLPPGLMPPALRRCHHPLVLVRPSLPL